MFELHRGISKYLPDIVKDLCLWVAPTYDRRHIHEHEALIQNLSLFLINYMILSKLFDLLSFNSSVNNNIYLEEFLL